jgi:hypothetical protein
MFETMYRNLVDFCKNMFLVDFPCLDILDQVYYF